MIGSFMKIIITGIVIILILSILRVSGLSSQGEGFIQRMLAFGLAPITYSTHSVQQCLGLLETKTQSDPRTQHELNLKLQQELVVLQGMSVENEILRKQLHFLENSKSTYRVASVIGRVLDPQRNVLLLNKGEQDGIKKGMPVIIDEGVLIGKITSTNNSISHVMLLNDSKSKLLATAPSTNGVKGIIEGNFSLGLLLKLIPIQQELHNGMIIATSGLEEYIPKGLVIGTISSVEKKPNDLFQSATITPSAQYQNISIVSVLLTY